MTIKENVLFTKKKKKEKIEEEKKKWLVAGTDSR